MEQGWVCQWRMGWITLHVADRLCFTYMMTKSCQLNWKMLLLIPNIFPKEVKQYINR